MSFLKTCQINEPRFSFLQKKRFLVFSFSDFQKNLLIRIVHHHHLLLPRHLQVVQLPPTTLRHQQLLKIFPKKFAQENIIILILKMLKKSRIRKLCQIPKLHILKRHVLTPNRRSLWVGVAFIPFGTFEFGLIYRRPRRRGYC